MSPFSPGTTVRVSDNPGTQSPGKGYVDRDVFAGALCEVIPYPADAIISSAEADRAGVIPVRRADDDGENYWQCGLDLKFKHEHPLDLDGPS